MSSYRVAFATFPWNGIMAWRTSDWCLKTVLEMKKDPRIEYIHPIYQSSSFPISLLRNRAVAAAIGEKCDYLLMIDYDMAPDTPVGKPFWSTAWEFMMERRRREETERLMPATIAAPYLCDSFGAFYSNDWKTDDTSKRDYEDLATISYEDAISRRGIQQVATTQTGLMLCDLRAFAYVVPPWFSFEWQDAYQFFIIASEDHYMTRKLSISGCPVYLAWDSWAAHIKTTHVTRGALEGEGLPNGGKWL